MKTVIGIFTASKDADNAITRLREAGFDPKDMSVVMKNSMQIHPGIHENEDVVGESTVSGAATGGIIGGIAGLLIGIGAITVPGIGALLIGGPIAAALGLTGAAATTVSGLATGILAGGLFGALVGLGFPEEEARLYESEIKAGGILIALATADEDAQDAREILEETDAQKVRILRFAEPEHVEKYSSPTVSSRYTVGLKGGKTKIKKKKELVEEE